MFALSYGHLYSQNAALFSTLFSELRAYYMGGGASRLAEALSEFWAALLERTLRLLLPHYELSADYMECAGRRAEELRPFGDIPRRLRIQGLEDPYAVCTPSIAFTARDVESVSQTSDSSISMTPTPTLTPPKWAPTPRLRRHSPDRAVESVSHTSDSSISMTPTPTLTPPKWAPTQRLPLHSPDRAVESVTRALGAARTLVQGLATASDIIIRATKTVPPPDCLRAAMRMWYCPLCRGHTGLLPCHGLCLNVMKGCLAHQADMDADWNSLIDGLQEVAERLTGPFNVELATESIAVKISEAIMTLQEESVQLTAQIFQSCGTPRPSRTKRSPQQEPRRTFHVYSNEEKPTSAAGTNIDRLVSDVVSKLRQLRGLWKLLPLSLCSDHRVSAGLSNQDRCWNGQTRGRIRGRLCQSLIGRGNLYDIIVAMATIMTSTSILCPSLIGRGEFAADCALR
ncbi:unnamed protein product [Ranitomeya imitator]|uniref:Uncharacterized protein n=1 Tax=Ranitomeya imitator TaxID=111125 RepID=A0ABN9L645_9NEOB|nr:unnamed protein product [Ranitomeya imitator]